MSSFSSLPGLKYGIFLAGTATLTPVFGFRPMRAPRSRSRKEPKPRSSIFWPSFRERTIASNTVSTMVSACFLVTSVATATRSINSAFVIAPLSSPRPAGDSVSTGASTLGDRVFRLLARPLLLRGGGLSFRFGRLCRRLDRSGLGNRLRLGRCGVGGGGGGGSLGARGLRSAARLQVRRR